MEKPKGCCRRGNMGGHLGSLVMVKWDLCRQSNKLLNFNAYVLRF